MNLHRHMIRSHLLPDPAHENMNVKQNTALTLSSFPHDLIFMNWFCSFSIHPHRSRSRCNHLLADGNPGDRSSLWHVIMMLIMIIRVIRIFKNPSCLKLSVCIVKRWRRIRKWTNRTLSRRIKCVQLDSCFPFSHPLLLIYWTNYAQLLFPDHRY